MWSMTGEVCDVAVAVAAIGLSVSHEAAVT